ncbi:hypothetical protein AB1Y20_003144 [Prymnesium parvum]|uniref:Protein FAM184A/B N-terminal domain-containing protein n=1 Tax=Prymnesium parvum TaxID=97485 RepID=A0AB34JCF7_PRYPA
MKMELHEKLAALRSELNTVKQAREQDAEAMNKVEEKHAKALDTLRAAGEAALAQAQAETTAAEQRRLEWEKRVENCEKEFDQYKAAVIEDMQKKREELVAAAEASAQEAERRASYELTLKEKLKEQEAVIVKLKAEHGVDIEESAKKEKAMTKSGPSSSSRSTTSKPMHAKPAAKSTHKNTNSTQVDSPPKDSFPQEEPAPNSLRDAIAQFRSNSTNAVEVARKANQQGFARRRRAFSSMESAAKASFDLFD